MSRRSSWLWGISLLCAWLTADAAQAQDRVRVAVASVEGPLARKIEGYIESALRSQVELVDAGSASPDNDGDFAALAAELEVQAIVSARTVKKRRFAVTITVHQGSDGSSVGEETWEQKKPAKLSVIQRELWSRLGSAIRNAEGPAAPEPEPAPSTSRQTPTRRTPSLPTRPSTDEEEQDELPSDEDSAEVDPEDGDVYVDASPRGTKRRPALRLELAFGPMWRDQAYNEAVTNVPFRYFNEVGSPAMWLGLAVAWYPVALVSDSALGNIGLIGGFGTALGLSSSTEDGTEIDTSASSYHVGVRGRIPIKRSEVGLSLAYGGRRFSTEAPAATPIPDVDYTYLRLAGDGHLAIADSIGLELSLGYLLRLSSGELEDATYFPELSGGGIDLGIGGVLAIGDTGLSLRAGLDWQYFYFSFNAPANAPRLAGGAVDHYYTFTISARYELTTK